jgi:hypothetical protein
MCGIVGPPLSTFSQKRSASGLIMTILEHAKQCGLGLCLGDPRTNSLSAPHRTQGTMMVVLGIGDFPRWSGPGRLHVAGLSLRLAR